MIQEETDRILICSLIDSIEWSAYETVLGPATQLPVTLKTLFADENADVYWDLENVVVVQGSLYTSAEPTTCVCAAALSVSLSPECDITILSLLDQIMRGGDAQDGSGTHARCCMEIQRSFWQLWVRAQKSDPDGKELLLDIIRIATDQGSSMLSNRLIG